MTSNIGSSLILEAGEITPVVQQSIETLLHKTFRPEFLNRIDETVFFKSLAASDIKNIVQVQIQNLQIRLKDRNITLQWSDAALSKLADLGYVKEFGARPLKRVIQQYVMSPLAVIMLKEPTKTQFTVEVQNGSLVIV
jgi:ATP-dependent Clp protease ATP-binding subunit ClpB